MPVVDCFNGVKICIYNGEHRPPHFHAIFNEYEVLIETSTGSKLAGFMPTKKMKMVVEWWSENSIWAMILFDELNQGLL